MKARMFFCFVAVVLISIVALPAFSQSQFVKTLGGTSIDYGYSVVEASDGGLVVAGWTDSYGAGVFDLLLTKFDGWGNHLWTRALGGTDYDYGWSVVEVSDGGLVVTGYTYSYGAGLSDLLLAKFDGWGNHLWTRTLGGTSYDYGYSVAEVSDGGLVVTGHTYSYGAGYYDLLLAKFDGSGNHLWTRALGGAGNDYGYSVAEVSDGGLVVAGWTDNYGAGLSDLLLAKFDGWGNHLWTRTLGGTSYDYGYSVAEASDGGLVVAGWTDSYGAADWDLLLTKFDGSGNHLWTRALGETYNDRARSVVEASDGGLVVTGYTKSYGAGDWDLLLAKFDVSGNWLWTRVLGGTNYDYGGSVVELSDGGLVVAGWTDSYGAGVFDLLLTKFDADGNTCMGEFVTPTFQSVSPTINTWDPTVNTWSPTITSPSPTVTSPTPTTTVVCENEPPTALIDEISPNPAGEGDTVTFSGHGTDTDGSIVGYWWSSSSAGSLSTDSSFSTCSLSVGTDTIYFKVQDNNGAWSEEVSETLVIQVGVEDERVSSLPHEFSLFQNYPNPFNPITQVKYALPRDCQVKLDVFNILGQKLASLVDGKQKAGYKTANWDAGSLSSGIYFYRLQAGDFVKTRKMVLLK